MIRQIVNMNSAMQQDKQYITKLNNDQREKEGPGWKVALDGYLEANHHNQFHGDTEGKHTVGNLMVLDTYFRKYLSL